MTDLLATPGMETLIITVVLGVLAGLVMLWAGDDLEPPDQPNTPPLGAHF